MKKSVLHCAVFRQISVTAIVCLLSGLVLPESAHPAPFGELIQTIDFPETVRTIAWSPDGRRIAVSNRQDNWVYLYDLTRDQLLWKVSKVGPRPSTSLAFDATGQIVITPSKTNWVDHADTTLSLLDAENGDEIKTISDDLPKNIIRNSLAQTFSFAPDKRFLAIVQYLTPNRILIYDSSTWLVSYHINVSPGGAQQIAIDDKTHTLIIAFIGGDIQLWDYSKNILLRKFQTLNSTLAAMVVNPITRDVISGGTGAIQYRRIASGDSPNTFETFKDDPTSLLNSWNPQTGKKVCTYAGPGLGVWGLGVSPDGKYVAAIKGKGVGKGTYLLVWNSSSCELIGQVDYPRIDALGVAFSEDSRKLAVAIDKQVQIFKY